ncbi:MAG: hypothetical protein I3273_01560 [Candidatus Moeniiplasma glomeromycotorum]|nr:hypothetical protein [Candidatus Moeniiplasma glomeromycotorum]MCE8167191.1 hypothetical protein [Candidatus Moeniiplasma glomeromycotorum]MCE8168797.1 hypothetical protein [Candidatus Moeniiplasma glomeromycotorum]
MPKNIIPKENLPKIVEVREIESEIPSYEEFAKSYQQEKVNYEDLSYSDISSSKVSGPCSYANSNCTCYASQGYAPLRTACPASGCSNRSVANWFHSRDGYLLASDQSDCGNLIVSSQGQIKCVNCETTSRFDNWKFKCSSQSWYQSIDTNSFVNSLSFASSEISNTTNQNIVRQLISYLFRSW